MTAVEYLVEKMFKGLEVDITKETNPALFNLIEQAKEMENKKAHEYAEFAIRCDRKEMKILNFEDWIKLETFKSE